MKIYLTFLLASILLDSGWANKCLIKKCGPCILPTCNFDGKCFFEGTSTCMLENEKCRREKLKLPSFTKTENGYCLEGYKKCTYKG